MQDILEELAFLFNWFNVKKTCLLQCKPTTVVTTNQINRPKVLPGTCPMQQSLVETFIVIRRSGRSRIASWSSGTAQIFTHNCGIIDSKVARQVKGELENEGLRPSFWDLFWIWEMTTVLISILTYYILWVCMPRMCLERSGRSHRP